MEDIRVDDFRSGSARGPVQTGASLAARADVRSFLAQTGESASEANKLLDQLLIRVRGSRPEPARPDDGSRRIEQDDSLIGVVADVRDEVQGIIPKLQELMQFI